MSSARSYRPPPEPGTVAALWPLRGDCFLDGENRLWYAVTPPSPNDALVSRVSWIVVHARGCKHMPRPFKDVKVPLLQLTTTTARRRASSRHCRAPLKDRLVPTHYVIPYNMPQERDNVPRAKYRVDGYFALSSTPINVARNVTITTLP